MTTTREPSRPQRRFRLAISLTATATLVGGLLAIGGGSNLAQADTVNSDVLAACNSPFGDQHVTIPAVVTDEPDPVTAGDQMTISYATSYPSIVADSFSIDLAESTWQMPDQVISIDDVTYTNTEPWTIEEPVIDQVAKTVVSTFTGGGINKPPTPTINITVTVDPEAGGQTMEWKVFLSTRSISSNIPFVGTIDSTCLPELTSIGQTLNTTEVQIPDPTSTTTSTSSSSTTTTTPGSTTTSSTVPSSTTSTTKATGGGGGGGGSGGGAAAAAAKPRFTG